MRARLAAFAVLPVLCLAYLASPLAAMWQLHRALDRGDTAALELRIDWPAVRDGLKQDIADGVIGPVETQLASNTLPPFGASFMTGIADTAVERDVTAQNLVAVMRQLRPAAPPASPLSALAHAFFESPGSFTIVLRTGQDDDEDSHLRIRLALRRGTWTVVRAWIPQDIVERSAKRA